jgi:hypothetical protein
MTRAGPVVTRRTEFDEFLYAPIGEEGNGMPLSVLSALARRHVDPWEEASRLAQLPRDAATRFLTALILSLPVDISGDSAEMHARRLSALLPESNLAVDHRSDGQLSVGVSVGQGARVRSVLYYALLAALFLWAQWLMQRSH